MNKLPNTSVLRNPDDPPPDDGKSSSLSDEIRSLLRGLRREVRAVREELKSLREERPASEGDSGALITRKEAADRLRVSTRTLDDLEASGRLRAVRIGRRVLYHPDTLDAFIRQQCRGGGR